QRGKAGVSLYIETVASLIAVCAVILTFSMMGFAALNSLHLTLIAGVFVTLLLLSSGPFLRRFSGHFKSLESLSPPKSRSDGKLLAKVVGMQAVVMSLHGTSLLLAILAFTPVDPRL